MMSAIAKVAVERPVRPAEGGTQCIHRSLGVMRLLASGSPQGLKLVEIADALELSRPTAHRILKALEQEDMVERVAGSRRYTMGSEVAWLGLSANCRYPIVSAAAPVLDTLAESITDSILLSVRSRNDSVYADRRLGSYPVQATRLSIGMRRPLGISVAGRVILSYMPEVQAQNVVEENRSRYQPYRCRGESILEEARRGRMQGFLCTKSVTSPSKLVLAVPVLDAVGYPVAAISVIAAQNRLPTDRIQRLVPVLRGAARQISDRLLHQARLA